MKRFCLFFLIALQPLAAEQERMTLEAEHFHFDGERICLDQQVVIEHPFGTLSAGKIHLIADSTETQDNFSLIELHEKLFVVFNEGGHLRADSAFIDTDKLYGHFFSGRNIPVTYEEETMHFRGNDLILHLGKMGRRVIVDSFLAEGDLVIEERPDWICRAGQCVYQREVKRADQKEKAFVGTLLLSRSYPGGMCELRFRNHRLFASSFSLDTEVRKLSSVKPYGTLAIRSPFSETIDFSAGYFEWREEYRSFQLVDEPKVVLRGFGSLCSQDTLKVSYEQEDDNYLLNQVHAVGPTKIDFDLDGWHKVDCFGDLCFDFKTLQLILESPQTELDEVLRDQQIFVQSEMGQVHADKLILTFAKKGEIFVPTKCEMEGEVRVLSYSPLVSQKKKLTPHYILADRMEYFPLTQELTLFAEEGRRVLFFEKEQNIQVSADSIQLKQKQESKKKWIKGLGDVRFSFVEAEFERLRENF